MMWLVLQEVINDESHDQYVERMYCKHLFHHGCLDRYMKIPPFTGRWLTNLPLDKMAPISQTTFSSAFSWMKSFVFWFEFHWILFRSALLTISQHWFINGLAPNRRQAISWSNADLVHWPIYVALGGDELTHCPLDKMVHIFLTTFSNEFSSMKVF